MLTIEVLSQKLLPELRQTAQQLGISDFANYPKKELIKQILKKQKTESSAEPQAEAPIKRGRKSADTNSLPLLPVESPPQPQPAAARNTPSGGEAMRPRRQRLPKDEQEPSLFAAAEEAPPVVEVEIPAPVAPVVDESPAVVDVAKLPTAGRGRPKNKVVAAPKPESVLENKLEDLPEEEYFDTSFITETFEASAPAELNVEIGRASCRERVWHSV